MNIIVMEKKQVSCNEVGTMLSNYRMEVTSTFSWIKFFESGHCNVEGVDNFYPM